MFCETLEEVTRDDVTDMIRMCVAGFSRLFDIYRPQTSDIDKILDKHHMKYTREEVTIMVAVEDTPDEFSTGENIQINKINSNVSNSNNQQKQVIVVRNGVHFDKIWDFIQDNRIIAQYLDAIIGLSTRANHDLFLKAQIKEDKDNKPELGVGAGLGLGLGLDPLVAPVTDHPIVAPHIKNRTASMIAMQDIELAQQQYTIKKNDDDDCLMFAMKKRSARKKIIDLKNNIRKFLRKIRKK